MIAFPIPGLFGGPITMAILYVVCDVEYCDLTMDTRAVGYGSTIHSQDALTKLQNWVVPHVATFETAVQQNF